MDLQQADWLCKIPGETWNGSHDILMGNEKQVNNKI